MRLREKVLGVATEQLSGRCGRRHDKPVTREYDDFAPSLAISHE